MRTSAALAPESLQAWGVNDPDYPGSFDRLRSNENSSIADPETEIKRILQNLRKRQEEATRPR